MGVNENTSDDDDSSETESNLSSDVDSSGEENGSQKGNERNEKLENLQNQLKSLDKVAISTRRITEENEKEGQASNPATPKNEFNAGSALEKSNFSNKTSVNEQPTTHDEERLAIRAELSKMSMEEILQLKEKLGSKLYNRALSSNSTEIKDTKSQKHGKD